MAEHGDKKILRKLRWEEYRLKQEQNVARLREQFTKYPNTYFRPSAVVRTNDIPEKCPFDGEPLMFIKNINQKDNSGWCCVRCFRHFRSTAKANPSRQPENKQEPTKTTIPKPRKQPKDLLQLPLEPQIIPKSTILAAKLQAINFGDVGWITIVSDANDQDSNKGIYWVGRSLPSMVLAAIQSEKYKRFKHKGILYRTISYTPYQETQKYLNIISRFCNPSSPQTVHVFAQKNIRYFERGNYEVVTAMVPCAEKLFPIPVSVYYDKIKRIYFINEAIYSRLRKQHGLPYLRLRAATPDDYNSWTYGALKPNSELNLLGYSVNSIDGLTAYERKKLLTEIMDSGVLSKHEIMNHLEWLINTRAGMDRMINAVAEWENDLAFVVDYQAVKQRAIWVDSFKSRFSGITKL